MTREEMLIAAREVKAVDADYDHHIRNLLSEGGVLRTLVGQILELRDGFAEATLHQDLINDTGRMAAIKIQGMVGGIDQVLTLIWQASQEKDNDPVSTDAP